MEKKILFLLVVLCILFLAVGFSLGLLAPKVSAPLAQTISPVFKTANSKVITSISASGKVTKVAGTVVTISRSGDNLDVNLPKSAKIYTFAATATSKIPVQTETTLSALKVGDNLSVFISGVLSNGQAQATTMFIIPQPAVPATK
jgi:hypothetical protein